MQYLLRQPWSLMSKKLYRIISTIPCHCPGNFYDKDVPLEKDKITFTFASFPMNRFTDTDTATSMLNFILTYEQKHGFSPESIAMYVRYKC